MPLAADPGSAGRDRGGPGASARPPRSATATTEPPNHYQLLGVPYGATSAEITRAYRRAMKQIHPDRQPATAGTLRREAAEEEARRLNRAYATLSKPLERQAYDRSIRSEIVQDQIMSRYIGGFAGPGMNGGTRPGAAPPPPLRREPTAAQRRERRRADRAALVSVVAVFGGLALVLILLLLLSALLEAALNAVV